MCYESQHCHCITEGSLQFSVSFFFFRNGLVKRLVLLNFAMTSKTEQLIFCLINLPLCEVFPEALIQSVYIYLPLSEQAALQLCWKGKVC